MADPAVFASMITAGKAAQRTSEFMLIARLESLIVGTGQEDALHRAELYSRAGADAILIHSRSTSPSEVLTFAWLWRERGHLLPLIVIPITYPRVTLDELQRARIKAVIYANQTLRAAISAMESVLRMIFDAGSSQPVESGIASVRDVLELGGIYEEEQLIAWFDAMVAERTTPL